MNLYLISQSDVEGYDTFSDAVVAAYTEDEARTIHPNHNCEKRIPLPEMDFHLGDWTNSPNKVLVTFIGLADPKIKAGVICASFHAG